MAGTAVRGRLTWQTATVSSVTDETPQVRTILLDVPGWPGHRAGQHVDVRLTADDGYQAERAYSIASAPGEPLAITVERLDDGEVSPYLTRGTAARGHHRGTRARSAATSSGHRPTAGRSCCWPAAPGVVPLRAILRYRGWPAARSRRGCCTPRAAGRT